MDSHPKDITSISFLAISIAYSAGLIFFAINEALINGRVDGFGVIIFWSGIFELLSWILFLICPLKKLNHNSYLFEPWLFPIISTFYLEAVFIILIGWAFLSTDYTIVFFVAAVVGLVFGLSYYHLIRSKPFNSFIQKGFPNRLIFLYPIIFLAITFWLFPLMTPRIAFRFMPDATQQRIVEKTIPKFNVGDDFEDLNRALPGYFDHIVDGTGSMGHQSTDFSFVVQVHCHIIVRLEHSGQTNPDYSIYGSWQDDPCPDEELKR